MLHTAFLKYNILFPLWTFGATSHQLSWLAEQSSLCKVFPAPRLLPAGLIIKNVLLSDINDVSH